MDEPEKIRQALADAADSPTAWFVVLERARRASDFELAAQAQRELERLGVKVKYTPATAKSRKAVRNDR